MSALLQFDIAQLALVCANCDQGRMRSGHKRKSVGRHGNGPGKRHRQ